MLNEVNHHALLCFCCMSST
uniref:Uncharacterized protein n=1 Tax=Arundo donax TaxID=35708 RepID=A0A0A9F638_ARUDO